MSRTTKKTRRKSKRKVLPPLPPPRLIMVMKAYQGAESAKGSFTTNVGSKFSVGRKYKDLAVISEHRAAQLVLNGLAVWYTVDTERQVVMQQLRYLQAGLKRGAEAAAGLLTLVEQLSPEFHTSFGDKYGRG
jgi:hypothetical protein